MDFRKLFFVHEWDWKTHPDWGKVRKGINALQNAYPYFYNVDTGSDSYAVLISGIPMEDYEVKKAYNEWKSNQ